MGEKSVAIFISDGREAQEYDGKKKLLKYGKIIP